MRVFVCMDWLITPSLSVNVYIGSRLIRIIFFRNRIQLKKRVLFSQCIKICKHFSSQFEGFSWKKTHSNYAEMIVVVLRFTRIVIPAKWRDPESTRPSSPFSWDVVHREIY